MTEKDIIRATDELREALIAEHRARQNEEKAREERMKTHYASLRAKSELLSLADN